MKTQIGNPIQWQKKNLDRAAIMIPCGKDASETKSTGITLGLSKPLLNKDRNYSLAFVTKSSYEYTVTLVILKKAENRWKEVINLNL